MTAVGYLGDALAADLATEAATRASADSTLAAALALKVAKGELVFRVTDAPYNAVANDSTSATAAFQAAADAAKAAGGGIVEVPPTTSHFRLPTPVVLDGHANVTFRGLNREASKIRTVQGFITATNSSDSCRVENLRVECVTSTNTYNAIDVTYPRRWWVTDCYFKGFGGDSVVYRGGLHSGTARNYVLAKDPSGTNGHSGILFTTSVQPGTTLHSDQDYVASGVQYGVLVSSAQNCVVKGPICEGTQVGIRFENSIYGALIDPYTEGTTVEAVQMHDSIVPVVSGRYTTGQGITRTWSGTAFADRYMTRIGRNYIDTGKGLLFGGPAGGTDPTLVPSIRAGSGSPEGVVTGVISSIWLRTNGTTDTAVYRKESGSGNTGWVAMTTGASAAIVSASRSNPTAGVNTIDRAICSTSATIVAGTAFAQHFTPVQALTVTQIGFCTSTSGTSGATLIRFGLYIVNGDDTLTLVAQTANDTSLLASSGTIYQKSFDTTGGWPSSYALVAGQRYATGLIVVGGSPGNLRAPTALPAALLADDPRLCSTLGTSLSDLPAGPTSPSSSGQILVWSQAAA